MAKYCPFCGAKGEDIKDDYCFKYCPNCGAKMGSEEISERNMKMWEEIFKAESEGK